MKAPSSQRSLGARVTPMAATKAFVRLAKAARISTTRLHDTRHTAATHLIVGGTDVRTAAGVLGHAVPSVTLSIYAHLVADTHRDREPGQSADLASQGNRTATVAPVTEKNARKIERPLVEARRLELLTLTLPA
jgi:hypothetical protein